MIQFKTDIPPQEVGPEARMQVAEILATFLPGDEPPYAVDTHGDGVIVLDGHNDWWCRMDDTDSQLVAVEYRSALMYPQRESALANRVIAAKPGWRYE